MRKNLKFVFNPFSSMVFIVILLIPLFLVVLLTQVGKLSHHARQANFKKHIEVISITKPYGIDKDGNGRYDTLVTDITIQNTNILPQNAYIDVSLKNGIGTEGAYTMHASIWGLLLPDVESVIPGRTQDTIRFELQRPRNNPLQEISPQQTLVIDLSNRPEWKVHGPVIQKSQTYDIPIEDFETVTQVHLKNKRIERKSIEGK